MGKKRDSSPERVKLRAGDVLKYTIMPGHRIVKTEVKCNKWGCDYIAEGKTIQDKLKDSRKHRESCDYLEGCSSRSDKAHQEGRCRKTIITFKGGRIRSP